MAKASRSIRKPIKIEPGELEDLIFSPAVGNGVSSHLLRDALNSIPFGPSEESRPGPTVDDRTGSTVGFVELPVEGGEQIPVSPAQIEGWEAAVSTVDTEPSPTAGPGSLSTVDTGPEATVDAGGVAGSLPLNGGQKGATSEASQATVVRRSVSTVDAGSLPTVDTEPLSPIGSPIALPSQAAEEIEVSARPTVDNSPESTVGSRLAPTVDDDSRPGFSASPEPTVDSNLPTTVDTEARTDSLSLNSQEGGKTASSATTVVPEPASTVDGVSRSTVDSEEHFSLFPHAARKENQTVTPVSTVDHQRVPTVTPPGPTPALRRSLRPFPSQRAYWQTEEGEVVPERRVKRIALAQDVLNSYEEKVYNTLWNAKIVRRDPADPDGRLVQAGYDYLCKRTNLAKKTIQRIIARLLDKDFISIDTNADIYTRTPTIYRVHSYRQVLQHHQTRGRLYVTKLGSGFVYVHPLEGGEWNPQSSGSTPPASTVDTPPEPTVDTAGLPTVVNNPAPTVDRQPETIVPRTTVTVGSDNLSTVVPETTKLVSKERQQDTSPSNELETGLEEYVSGIDAGAVKRIWRECRVIVPDANPEEILYFFGLRGKLLFRNPRVENPLGLMLSTIHDWFVPRRVFARREEQENEHRAQEELLAQIERERDLLR